MYSECWSDGGVYAGVGVVHNADFCCRRELGFDQGQGQSRRARQKRKGWVIHEDSQGLYPIPTG